MAQLEALAIALAGGQSVRRASEVSGISRRSIWRRLHDPNFRARVSALRAEAAMQAAGILASGMTEAAEKLRSLLHAESESVALAAAKTLLELAVKFRETMEIEDRLKRLEAKELSCIVQQPSGLNGWNVRPPDPAA
jgi:hypothetical protein